MYITHPSKEQVRAYMQRRETAHRPPPAPDEIRRQLGWSCCPQASSSHIFFLPADITRLGALLAIEWLFRAGGVHPPHSSS